MTLSEIIQNRPHYDEEIFIGTICVKDRHGIDQQTESFKTRSERKKLNDLLSEQYHEKLLFNNWTLNITLE